MKTKNPIVIKLVQLIQASKPENEKNIIKAIDEILKDPVTINLSHEDWLQIAKLLIHCKHKLAVHFILNNVQELRDQCNIGKLLAYSFQHAKEISEYLLDTIIQDITGIIKGELMQNEIINDFHLFKKLWDYDKTLVIPYLRYYSELITDDRIYEIVKNEPDIVALETTQLFAMYSDTIIHHILKERFARGYADNLNTAQQADIICQLIINNRVASFVFFVKQLAINSDTLYQIISSHDLCLIRSLEMYSCIADLCDDVNEAYLQGAYLKKLCSQLSVDGTNLARAYQLGGREHFEELLLKDAKKPLELLESQLNSPYLSEDLHLLADYPHLALAAAKLGCSKLIKVFFDKDSIGFLSEKMIVLAFNACFVHQDKELIRPFIQNLPLQTFLRDFFLESIDSVYSAYITMFIEYHGQAILEDEKLITTIRQKVISPKTAKAFIELGIVFDDEEKFLKIALNQRENHLIAFFQRDSTPSNTQENSGQIVAANDAQQMQQLYGQGITQEEYKNAFKEIVAIIHYAIEINEFNLFLGNNPLKPSPFGLFSFASTANSLQNNKLFNLNVLGSWRQYIAKIAGSPIYMYFGGKRGYWRMATPQTQRYAPYMQDFVNMFELGNYDKTRLNYEGYLIFEGAVTVSTCIEVEIENMKVQLTSTGMNQGRPSWFHTEEQYIPVILAHADKLIQDIIAMRSNEEESRESLIHAIAKVHWWMAHATPFARGSAAITEMIISALFQYHNLSIEWSVLPDCKALIEPSVENFVKNYQSFTKITPILDLDFIKDSEHEAQQIGL